MRSGVLFFWSTTEQQEKKKFTANDIHTCRLLCGLMFILRIDIFTCQAQKTHKNRMKQTCSIFVLVMCVCVYECVWVEKIFFVCQFRRRDWGRDLSRFFFRVSSFRPSLCNPRSKTQCQFSSSIIQSLVLYRIFVIFLVIVSIERKYNRFKYSDVCMCI